MTQVIASRKGEAALKQILARFKSPYTVTCRPLETFYEVVVTNAVYTYAIGIDIRQVEQSNAEELQKVCHDKLRRVGCLLS
ncbi:hypothetical protein FZC66_11500 [Priestia megaterium]|nr:hypothetical protein FZC66_11500 [Priestia megaterium]